MSSASAGVTPELLARLPVFPLPGVVLFPHALMPLHIFEPRYRKMTRDVLASHKHMIVAQRLEDERPEGPPPRFAEVCGVGEVVMATPLPDGRFQLVLQGRARVHVVQELASDEPYRLVAARELPDRPPRRPDDLPDAEASLRALVTELAETLPEGGELLKQLIASQVTAAELADVVAAALVPEPMVRQRLLETVDPLLRLEALTAEIAGLTARLRPQGRGN
jgi:Lon protease-like protein